MAEFKGPKERILFLLDYFQEHTDEQHMITTEEIIDLCRKNGFGITRNTVADDIAMLRKSGLDIVMEPVARNRTRMNGYSIGARMFETEELKILADAVSAAQFITRERSAKIIGKLTRLTSAEKGKELVPDLYVAEHVKARNHQILYTMEKIAEAIRNRKKISFRYYNYNTDKERIFRHNEELYILTPYATLWKEDRYYVVGWSEKRETIVTFRIDRMPVPEILEEDAIPAPAGFNIQDYADKFTRMFGGRQETVSLRCKTWMIDQIIDKFGLDAEIFNVKEDTFDVSATVAVGSTFLAWAFQYVGNIIILSPDRVREMYSAMQRTAQREIETGEFENRGETIWKL